MLKSKRDPTVKAKPLTDYMLQAEELWLKDVQFQLMSKTKTRKWEREFGLYRDERGILRCEGGLKNAKLTTTQKHPAILDAEHYVTSLIVRDSHERVKHNGVKETLTEIRSKFWIVRGRQYVRKLIHECAVYVDDRKELLTNHQIHQHYQYLESRKITLSRTQGWTSLDHFM